MNNVNMANMPMAGGPIAGGPMAMMGNNALAAGQVQQRPPENNRANLNTYIYDYFIREGMFDCARAMLNSDQALNVHKSPPRNQNNGLGDDPMDTDSKEDMDSKRPSDLPAPNVPQGSDSCFLYEWFCLFWDMLSAQRNKGGVSPHVTQYVAHTQVIALCPSRQFRVPVLVSNIHLATAAVKTEPAAGIAASNTT